MNFEIEDEVSHYELGRGVVVGDEYMHVGDVLVVEVAFEDEPGDEWPSTYGHLPEKTSQGWVVTVEVMDLQAEPRYW